MHFSLFILFYLIDNFIRCLRLISGLLIVKATLMSFLHSTEFFIHLLTRHASNAKRRSRLMYDATDVWIALEFLIIARIAFAGSINAFLSII
jgi:hypothetical protein